MMKCVCGGELEEVESFTFGHVYRCAKCNKRFEPRVVDCEMVECSHHSGISCESPDLTVRRLTHYMADTPFGANAICRSYEARQE